MNANKYTTVDFLEEVTELKGLRKDGLLDEHTYEEEYQKCRAKLKPVNAPPQKAAVVVIDDVQTTSSSRAQSRAFLKYT